MSKERRNPTQADPARNEPSAARAESCACRCDGREPDPTDDNLRVLRELRDLAMAVAKKLAAQILDDDAGQPAGEVAEEQVAEEPGDAPKRHGQLSAAALAFHRAERDVRQCILLSNKLHDDRLARETQRAAVAAKAEQQQRERRKSQVARLAREAIERDAANRGGDADELLEKLDLRIDEEDIDSDIGRIADSAIVARLCRDYGVEAPWDDWAGQHWAQEEVRRKPPGSVFAGAAPAAAPEPEEGEPVEAEPLQPEADEPAASAAELPEPEPPKPEPDTPYETDMKARLRRTLHSGAWVMGLQMDPRLASYVHSRLMNSS